jgi:hypothetical protein
MTDTLHNGADSATPGARLPAGTTILYVYVAAGDLPDPGDARHVWTRPEINQYLNPDSPLYGGPSLRVVPMYVHDFAGNASLDAQNMCDAVSDLGWSNTEGRIIEIDLETLEDPAYVGGLIAPVARLGFRLGKYGSLSTINANPPCPGGTRFAAWQKRKPSSIPAGIGDAWQWATPGQVGGDWDLTVATQFVYDHAGRGLRRIEP